MYSHTHTFQVCLLRRLSAREIISTIQQKREQRAKNSLGLSRCSLVLSLCKVGTTTTITITATTKKGSTKDRKRKTFPVQKNSGMSVRDI